MPLLQVVLKQTVIPSLLLLLRPVFLNPYQQVNSNPSRSLTSGTADSSKQGGGRLSEADIIGLAVSIPILLLAAVIIWASVYGARKLKDKRKLEKEGRHERVPLQDWGYI